MRRFAKSTQPVEEEQDFIRGFWKLHWTWSSWSFFLSAFISGEVSFSKLNFSITFSWNVFPLLKIPHMTCKPTDVIAGLFVRWQSGVVDHGSTVWCPNMIGCLYSASVCCAELFNILSPLARLAFSGQSQTQDVMLLLNKDSAIDFIKVYCPASRVASWKQLLIGAYRTHFIVAKWWSYVWVDVCVWIFLLLIKINSMLAMYLF